jgi:hypothetical protein
MLLALLITAPVHAQQVLHGVVRDPTGAPLAEAQVTLFGLRVPTAVVRSDADGRFRFDRVPRGGFWVHARRLGSQPARHSITVEHGRAPREVVIELQPVPPTLDAVVARAAVDHDFARDAREASDAAMRLVGIHVSDPTVRTSSTLLSHAGGVTGNPSPLVAFTAARGVRAPCVPAFSINGGYPVPGLDPDAIPIEQVEAVECFRAGAGTPIALQFQQPRGTCGMVRIWLRNTVS